MKEARHKSYITRYDSTNTKGTVQVPPHRKQVSGRQEWDVEGNVLNRRSVSF